MLSWKSHVSSRRLTRRYITESIPLAVKLSDLVVEPRLICPIVVLVTSKSVPLPVAPPTSFCSPVKCSASLIGQLRLDRRLTKNRVNRGNMDTPSSGERSSSATTAYATRYLADVAGSTEVPSTRSSPGCIITDSPAFSPSTISTSAP
jgi:hypothetical protein